MDAEREIRVLKNEVRELKDALRKLLLNGVNKDIGGRGSSVKYLYLEDPKRAGAFRKLSWDADSGDWRDEGVS